jgi:hypothetical protein
MFSWTMFSLCAGPFASLDIRVMLRQALGQQGLSRLKTRMHATFVTYSPLCKGHLCKVCVMDCLLLVWTVRYVLMLVVLIDAREIKRLESLRSAIYIKHLASTLLALLLSKQG